MRIQGRHAIDDRFFRRAAVLLHALPFGKGKHWPNGSAGLVNRLVSGGK
jgi:hypothetical protein